MTARNMSSLASKYGTRGWHNRLRPLPAGQQPPSTQGDHGVRFGSIADLSEQAPRCPLRAGSGRSVAFTGVRTVYRQYTRYKKAGLRDRPPKLRLQLNEFASARKTMSDIEQRSITPSEAVSYRRTL
jgi:hypothetical protein